MPSLPPLAYAVTDDRDVLLRDVRVAIAWLAIVVGSVTLAGNAVVALSIAGAFPTGINFGGWGYFARVQIWAELGGSLAMTVGGVWLICSDRLRGLWLVRIGS